MREFFGVYHRYGYEIIERDGDGSPIYSAGNSPFESSTVVPRKEGLPLKTLASYCRQMGKAMAREADGTFTGAYRDKEAEAEIANIMEGKS